MHLSQYIEEMGGRTDTAGTDIMLSIPFVNGGTLLFQLTPIIGCINIHFPSKKHNNVKTLHGLYGVN